MDDHEEQLYDLAFGSVPKLVGRGNFTTWKNKMSLALHMIAADT
jgi:hypothetical protein